MSEIIEVLSAFIIKTHSDTTTTINDFDLIINDMNDLSFFISWKIIYTTKEGRVIEMFKTETIHVLDLLKLF